jgi:hypothetical protein
MYFTQSIDAVRKTFQIFLHDRRFLYLSIFLALFGSTFQGYEFFRLRSLSIVLTLSASYKLAYLLWQLLSWIVSLLLGSILLPAFILMVRDHEQGKIVPLKEVFGQSKEIVYRFIVLLFTYYNLLFIVAGGGLLVVVVGLASNIFYNLQITTIYNLTNNAPLVGTFLTIAVIASALISLLYVITSQILVLEGRHVIDSIIEGMRLVHTQFPVILTSWVVVNIITLIPLIVLSLFLRIIEVIDMPSASMSFWGFVLGIVLFLLVYTPVIAFSNIFWTEVYLKITPGAGMARD